MKIKRLLIVLLSVALISGMLPAAYAAGGVLAGDVSGDGKVTAEDARLCLRRAVGLETYEEGSPEFLACDVVQDGKVTAEDARSILRAAVGLEVLHVHEFGDWTSETDEAGALTGRHFRSCACGETETLDCTYSERVQTSENAEPTCTEDATFEKTCAVCGGKATETVAALGHSFGEAAMSVDTDLVCDRCGETIPSFNTIVNGLKSSPHTFTGFSESTNSGKVLSHKFDIPLAVRLLAKSMGESLDEETLVKQFSEELTNSAQEYGNYAMQRTITNSNFLLGGKSTVSELTAADIKSLTVEETEGIDFLASLPDTIKIKSSYSSATFELNLAEKIKAANIGKVKKVTVTIKDEDYASIKDSTEDTALMKIMGQDLRELVGDLNQSDNSDGMKYEMKCDEASSSGSVTYYLDAVTYAPIAAVYNMTVNSTEKFEIEMTLDGISDVKLPISGKLMSGNMSIQMQNNSASYYFFDSYFD